MYYIKLYYFKFNVPDEKLENITNKVAVRAYQLRFIQLAYHVFFNYSSSSGQIANFVGT
jgi:hypothetical protein